MIFRVLSVSNFAEGLLQAWDAFLQDVGFKKCLSSVVKTVMLIQVSVAYGCMQLRRHYYLSSAKGSSTDAIFTSVTLAPWTLMTV